MGADHEPVSPAGCATIPCCRCSRQRRNWQLADLHRRRYRRRRQGRGDRQCGRYRSSIPICTARSASARNFVDGRRRCQAERPRHRGGRHHRRARRQRGRALPVSRRASPDGAARLPGSGRDNAAPLHQASAWARPSISSHDERGTRVINLSLGGPPDRLLGALLDAAQALWGAGGRRHRSGAAPTVASPLPTPGVLAVAGDAAAAGALRHRAPCWRPPAIFRPACRGGRWGIRFRLLLRRRPCERPARARARAARALPRRRSDERRQGARRQRGRPRRCLREPGPRPRRVCLRLRRDPGIGIGGAALVH